MTVALASVSLGDWPGGVQQTPGNFAVPEYLIMNENGYALNASILEGNTNGPTGYYFNPSVVYTGSHNYAWTQLSFTGAFVNLRWLITSTNGSYNTGSGAWYADSYDANPGGPGDG